MNDTGMKRLVVTDRSKGTDISSITATHRGTDIRIDDLDTGETIFPKLHNKVILPGAEYTAKLHFKVDDPILTPSYNEVLMLDNSAAVAEPRPGQDEIKTYLFAIGTDGCGQQNSQVFDVNYGKWITPDALVPFRYVPEADDIDLSLRDKYFGRKLITTSNPSLVDEGPMVAYYFKGFETDPILIRQFIDGTPIDSAVYDTTKPEEVETYIELKLKVLKEDAREWFICTTGINDARVNTISLLYGWPKQIDGITYYQDLRPLTKLNFPNEQLIDYTKGLDITYHIYY